MESGEGRVSQKQNSDSEDVRDWSPKKRGCNDGLSLKNAKRQSICFFAEALPERAPCASPTGVDRACFIGVIPPRSVFSKMFSEDCVWES